MKTKFPSLILIFFSIYYLSAQKKVSKQELQRFTKVYKQVLDNPFDVAASMKKCVKQLNIPEEKMAKILQSYFTGEKIKLSDTEKKQLKQLKKLMELDKSVHDKKINKIIKDTEMGLSQYREIEKKYHQNNELQKKVNLLSAKK